METPPRRSPARCSRQARELREAIDALLVAAIDGAPAPPAAAITLIDDWLVFAGVRPQLVAEAGGAPAADRARRRRLAAPRAGHDRAGRRDDARHAEQRARIRICASETCSGRFFDRSPAGRRRWCSMRTCGNEAKARRHRERQKAGA